MTKAIEPKVAATRQRAEQLQFLRFLGDREENKSEMAGIDHITLLVKPTHKCNLNCEYCYDRPNRRKIGDVVMSHELVEEIVKRIPDGLPVTWIWHGGECSTIEPEWFYEAHRIISSYPNKDLVFSMQSNGYDVSNEFLKMCKDCGINIGFSFDYDTQEKRMKQDSMTQKTLDTLTRAREMLGAAGVITVIHDGNIDKMIDIYEQSKDVSGSVPAFNFVFGAENASKYGVELTNEKYQEYVEDFFYHVATDKEARATTERGFDIAFRGVMGAPAAICHCSDCRYHYLCIDPVGRIHPCDRVYEDKYVYPDVRELGSVLDYFTSSQYQLWYFITESRVVKHCKKCVYYDVCNGGCYSTHYWENQENFENVYERECNRTRISYDAMASVLLRIKDTEHFNYRTLKGWSNYPVVLPWELKKVVQDLKLGGDLQHVFMTLDQYQDVCKKIGVDYAAKNLPLLKYCRILSKVEGTIRPMSMGNYYEFMKSSKEFVIRRLISAAMLGLIEIPESDVCKLREQLC